MELMPSEIYFSQDKINNHFGNHSVHRSTNVGQTLDDIVDGRCSLYNIPTISVMKRNGRWVTADNRRLWVFRHLEKLGNCTTIPVRETSYINPEKLNSLNGGRTVRFYSGRCAIGRWHQRVRSIDPGEPIATNLFSRPNATSNSMFSSSPNTSCTDRQHYRPFTPRFDSNSRQQTPSSILSGIQTARLTSIFRTLELTNEDVASELNPADIRYTKESINIDTFFTNLEYSLCYGLKNQNDVDPVTVYNVFGKHWVTDGNKRLWSFKDAQSRKKTLRIRADVNDDKEEFLDEIRTERPWLSLIDILQSGESIQTI